MKKTNLIQESFLSSVGVLVYVGGVSLLIMNGDKLFGQAQNFWGPVLFLLLFVFSALVTGLLVLGRPIWLYLEKEKKEAVRLLLYTVGWLFIMLVMVLGIKVLVG
jgi:hypothetical protein